MRFKLSNSFDFADVHYDVVTVPDYLQVGHRKAYAKFKDLDPEEAGVSLCAALCEIPEAAFDKISLKDFEQITEAVRQLFEGETRKKLPTPRKKKTSLVS